jgi:hypothetical protein
MLKSLAEVLASLLSFLSLEAVRQEADHVRPPARVLDFLDALPRYRGRDRLPPPISEKLTGGGHPE